MKRAVVVGAGVGGLVAAGLLAARGWSVTVLEALDRPGGKAGLVELDGVPFDTGPSVLTMPEVFEDVLRALGREPASLVRWRRSTPAFRYLWPDGVRLDVHDEPERTLASVGAALGPGPEAELAAFLGYTRRIWEAAGPRFVRGPAPTFGSVLSPAAWRDLLAIDPLRTMAGGISAHVREPHLRDLLLRYATYNGSDPRRAPATLNCIAWVELGLGGWGVEGGIGALVRALVVAAEGAGVELRCGTPARGLARSHGRVVGVETDGGTVPADAVVANLEAGVALGWAGRRAEPPTSTSGWNAIVATPVADRVAHTVVFPERYLGEFEDLFDRGRPPEDPTVYACAPRLAHAHPGLPDGREGVFLMANTPSVDGPIPTEALRERVLARARAAGVVSADATVRWERTPHDLAVRFPGSRGALYGAASNDATAAFRRPANRSGVPGLYLATGSAHPGGGLPLVALSGRAAAAAIVEDHGAPRDEAPRAG
jgi:phytoene desaturase